MNLNDSIIAHARSRPDHPAIEDNGKILTYREFESQILNAASNLQQLGLKTGDIVAVQQDDSAELFVLLFALTRLGVVFASFDTSISLDMLQKSVEILNIKACFVHSIKEQSDYFDHIATGSITVKTTRPFSPAPIDDSANHVVVQSSGTTQAPSMFFRTYRQQSIVLERYAANHRMTEATRALSLSKLSFNVGWSVSSAVLATGGTIIINRVKAAAEIADFIARNNISYLKLTPTHVAQIADQATGNEPILPSVDAMVVGSARTSHEQRLYSRKHITKGSVEQMGTNEAGLMTISWPEDQDAFPDAVGRIVGGITAEVVDTDDQPLPFGEVGQIRYKAGTHPKRYLNNPEKSARSFRGDWFYPGDLAAMNEQGYLFFKGRADDVINNFGSKFYPSEVEGVLLKHPDISEVAVMGVPHKYYGEVAAACFIARNPVNKETLAPLCAQHLSGHKIPHYYVSMEKFPKNPMGKILKNQLRDQIVKLIEKK